jgi:hypothetical protein
MPWAFVKTGARNVAPTDSLYQSLPIRWERSVQHQAKVFSCQVSIFNAVVIKPLLFDCVVMLAYVLLMQHLTAMPWIYRANAHHHEE